MKGEYHDPTSKLNTPWLDFQVDPCSATPSGSLFTCAHAAERAGCGADAVDASHRATPPRRRARKDGFNLFGRHGDAEPKKRG